MGEAWSLVSVGRGESLGDLAKGMIGRTLPLLGALLCTGCALLPEIAHQPTLHNPFPQLSKVAVAPFFNLSTEPTLDGRRFSLAYANELQQVPGFEVVPVGTVERAMKDLNLKMTGPEDARKLGKELGVDAIVIGAVTDYTPYYPPRCSLQVEWYATNEGFHPIPPGYGLPWGTPEEEHIPGPLLFEAEMALAKAQLDTQTPTCQPTNAESAPNGAATGPVAASGLPPQWPDPRGFIPPPPKARPEPCWPQPGPVMRHTQAYNGNDSRFTEALASYYYFQDDARFGGWQNYLQRSDDFIRFCCRMHLWEMLSARGGAGETRVVWRWPTIR